MNSRLAMSIHVLVILAESPGRFVSSSVLAQEIGTNAVVVRQLSRALRLAGLVVAKAGHVGGLRLRLPPHQVRLAQVFDAVHAGEGLLGLGKTATLPELHATIRAAFGVGAVAFRDALQELTLQDCLGVSRVRFEKPAGQHDKSL